MINVCIIGNGFDLYHKLPTTFSDFIKKRRNIEKNEFRYNVYYNEILSSYQRHNDALSNRPFKADTDWNNVEEYLACCSGKAIEYQKMKQTFISDFSKYLQENVIENINKINSKVLNKKIIEILNTQDIILNFNYTNTLNMYIDKNEYENKVFHIHGSLEEGELIIGHGISFDLISKVTNQNISFKSKDEERKLRNGLYKYQFDALENYEETISKIESGSRIKLTVIGHSLGITDTYELKKIIDVADVIDIYVYRKQEISVYKSQLRDIYGVNLKETEVNFFVELFDSNILFPYSSKEIIERELSSKRFAYTENDLIDKIANLNGINPTWEIENAVINHYTLKSRISTGIENNGKPISK